MNSLFHDNDPPLRNSADDDSRRAGRMRSADREFTLSTGTVLAMFLALAVLCAAFFGFGYSLGRKSGQVVASANLPADADAAASVAPVARTPDREPAPAVPAYEGAAADAGAAKPAAAKPVSSAPVAERPAPAAAESANTPAVPVKTPASPGSTGRPLPAAQPVAATQPTATALPAPRPAPSPAPPADVASKPAAAVVYVQVAAVSHTDDANAMVAALRRKGYTVLTRQSPTDSLIHIQVGPFSNRKDAETMKQRLSGDGYNAILK